jgi:uncharacterized membrane protein
MKKEIFRNEKTLHRIAIVSFVLLNIVFKSVYLGYHNIDLDEPTTVLRSVVSFSDFMDMLKYETNQPLFFVIMHFWIKLFGLSPVSLRFLPMLFSSLAVIFIYLIGKKYTNTVIAVAASLLYTFSNMNMHHAHDARVYGLFVFLATASMYWYFSMISSENKKKYAIALTITNILMLYAHLCGAFLLLVQVLYTLLLNPVRKKIIKEHIVSSLITFLAFLPYIIFVLPSFKNPVEQINIVVEKTSIFDLAEFLIMFSNSQSNYYWFISILLIFVLVAIITRKEVSIYQKMIFGWFLIPYLLMFAISTKVHVNVPRFMIFITPAYYFTIVIAAYYCTRFKAIGISLVVFLVCFMAMSADAKVSNELQVSDAVKAIRKYKTGSSKVYIVPPWIGSAFSYHYNPDLLKDYKNMDIRLNEDHIFLVKEAPEIDTASLKTASNVLLLDGWNNMAMVDPQHKIYNTLMREFRNVDTVANVKGYVVYNFRRPIAN